MVVFKPEPISLTNEAVKDFYFELLAVDKSELFLELRDTFKDEDGLEQMLTRLADQGLRLTRQVKKVKR